MKKDIIDLELLLDKDLEKFDWVYRLINIYIIFFSQKISVQTELDLAGWPWKSITQSIIHYPGRVKVKHEKILTWLIWLDWLVIIDLVELIVKLEWFSCKISF